MIRRQACFHHLRRYHNNPKLTLGYHPTFTTRTGRSGEPACWQIYRPDDSGEDLYLYSFVLIRRSSAYSIVRCIRPSQRAVRFTGCLDVRASQVVSVVPPLLNGAVYFTKDVNTAPVVSLPRRRSRCVGMSRLPDDSVNLSRSYWPLLSPSTGTGQECGGKHPTLLLLNDIYAV